jgi:hypothetical protein
MTYQIFYWYDIKLMREEKETVSSHDMVLTVFKTDETK